MFDFLSTIAILASNKTHKYVSDGNSECGPCKNTARTASKQVNFIMSRLHNIAYYFFLHKEEYHK